MRDDRADYKNDNVAPECAFEAFMEHFMDRFEELKSPDGGGPFEVERAKGATTTEKEKGFEHCNMATRIRAKSRETSGFDSFPGWKTEKVIKCTT